MAARATKIDACSLPTGLAATWLTLGTRLGKTCRTPTSRKDDSVTAVSTKPTRKRAAKACQPGGFRAEGEEGRVERSGRAGTVRVLAADAVQKVGNGHPGTAMSPTRAGRVSALPKRRRAGHPTRSGWAATASSSRAATRP